MGVQASSCVVLLVFMQPHLGKVLRLFECEYLSVAMLNR
jgi:hypothetical protein